MKGSIQEVNWSLVLTLSRHEAEALAQVADWSTEIEAGLRDRYGARFERECPRWDDAVAAFRKMNAIKREDQRFRAKAIKALEGMNDAQG